MIRKKYIYIDDEKDSKVDSLIDNINRQGAVIIEKCESMIFSKFVQWIQVYRKEYDGILLDLILNEKANSKNEIAEYTAPVIAQYLRTIATDGQMQNLPIVLCSTDERLDRLYTNDLTSHDLFDMRFRKDDTDHYQMIAKELNSLATGYEEILQLQDIDKILKVDGSQLNDKIFARFYNRDSIPEHEKAQFILKEMIFKTGPLIDEYVLAARLGIDIKKSSDWQILKDTVFAIAKYKGVFSDGWDRWWMYEVNNIFKSLTGTNLSYINAEDRVRLLKDKLALENLLVFEPSKYCFSTRYWTIDINSKEPLDPSEGFRVATSVEPKSWQEYNYISPYSALERIGQFSVHISDHDRLEYLKKSLEN